MLIITLTSSLCLLLVCASTSLAIQRPPTPVFVNNYKVEGVLSLPYAELNEPFVAWFDNAAKKSRSDFYNKLYQVFQFGPDKSSSENKYGSLYKIAWVPATDAKEEKFQYDLHFRVSSPKTKTRRACFQVRGSDVGSIGPQSVLPDLGEYQFDSYGACPPTNIKHLRSECELWKLTTSFGEKKNVYKMWILSRNPRALNISIPVQFYMQGYDSLLGSHYDRYDIKYFNFILGGASSTDFNLEEEKIDIHNDCEPMGDLGTTNSTTGSQRAHMIAQNPFHEFVSRSHQYDHIDSEHAKLIDQYGKIYVEPKLERKAWFSLLHNLRFIHRHNRKVAHFKLNVNRFADNDLHELSYLRGRRPNVGYNGGISYDSQVGKALKTKDSTSRELNAIPESWDWRLQGAVTQVKDQAVCGSCWSFGTSGSIEGAFFVKTGGKKLLRLSQQQMIDCSWPFGNNACDGGEDSLAYKYIMQAGGLATEEDYGPYIGVDGKCHDRDIKKSVKLSGFYNVTSNNVNALKDAIIKFGPVTVAIDASRPTFTFYSHGVYYDEKCKNTLDGLDHQVLVVGFGKIEGQDYWLVKNSWSTYWGNDGYILMAVKDNNCGVMTVPTVPIVSAA